ncbi:hypothetical protein M2283_009625 [Streptomyces pseudovenezuelae]|uniref:Transposase IS4-like domain-containing protein n=1 Tax=Streptomyces pseudovenezuelae TaxID=67350 RepID=A0ABT6M143_9ACTN|nr:hypothetical protein [Streptomyces pseudovenezuelae]
MSYVVRRTLSRGAWSWIVPDGLWEIANPLIPPSRVRPQGAGTQDTPDETRGKPGSRMHVLSDANGLPLLVGISAGNTHDSEGLKPMIEGHQTRHDPHRGRYFKPQRLHADKAYDHASLRK